MNDVEFGGNDLLQIYNPQQIKHRLNSNGMNNIKLLSYNYSLLVFLVFIVI